MPKGGGDKMKKSVSIFLIVGSFLLLSKTFSQQSEVFDKDRFIQTLQAAIAQQLTPDEIRRKIREAGITEEEAIRMAKERGISLEDYFRKVSVDTTGRETKIQVAQPGTPAVELKVPALEQKPPSEVISALRDTTPAPKGPHGLTYFGYDIFKQIPAAFEPNAVGPIDPGYLLGPGDVLRLTVWGAAEFQYQLEVDPEGRIFIPKVGQVFVLGTPLNKLEEKLENQLSKYYSGLAARPPTVFMDVSLTKLRPLRIFVMGEVKHPGGYTISSYATVFNALYGVGGPLVRGTLRNVKVLRDNKVVAIVDLYDYLLRGDQTSDVRLQNNDLIFIGPRGKTVFIRGEVLRPAIYELKEDEHLNALIHFAGGLLSTAYLDNAQIDRVKPFDERTKGIYDRMVVDFNLGELVNKVKNDIPLFDADDVQIFSILSEKRNFVSIGGSVWRPGQYELGKIQTIRDLIAAAQGIQPKTYLGRAEIVRLNEDLITSRIIPFDLGKVLADSKYDQKLLPRDSVTIYGTDVTEVKDDSVSIFGQVRKPGAFPLRSNMTLTDLILEAGGFTEGADRSVAEVSRIPPEGLRGDSLSMILRLKLPADFAYEPNGDSSLTRSNSEIVNADEFHLERRDQVLILANPDYKLQQNVIVEGEVVYPGTYAIQQKGERLSDILARAGGPTKTAYLGGAKLFRGGRRVLVDFEEAYSKKDDFHDIIMFPGDQVVVPPRPRTVMVSGEVNNPGLQIFVEGLSVSDCIDRAGGRTDSAQYALLTLPTGETRKVDFGWFHQDPEVLEGSTIVVTKKPAEPPSERKEFDLGATIKDSFAVVASAATIIYLISQVKK
jgi:polysaccharide export outer membrane protein